MAFNIFRRHRDKKSILEVAQKQMREHFDVPESLRQYDRGEKDISTREVEGHLPLPLSLVRILGREIYETSEEKVI